jgi:choline transport protein
MSEEVQDASKTVPKVLVWAVGSNAAMLLIVGYTYIFCIGDLDSVLNSATGQPAIQVFYNATKSIAGTSVMIAVIIVIFMSACVGQVATASRQMWSFARDKGKLRKQNDFNNLWTNTPHFATELSLTLASNSRLSILILA